jgi:hypothetical protein
MHSEVLLEFRVLRKHSLVLLLPDGTVPVDSLTFKKAVTHHALAKQEEDDYQNDYKQELSDSERWWLRSCWV